MRVYVGSNWQQNGSKGPFIPISSTSRNRFALIYLHMKEHLSNEEIWLDPSDRIRNLDKGEVDVRNYPKEGSEKHGSFSVSEPPAGIPGFGKCSLMIFFPNVLNAEWTDLGPPPRGPSMANGEKVFLTQAAIEMIRPHSIPQFHYLLELPISNHGFPI